jgi:hypothetical protein
MYYKANKFNINIAHDYIPTCNMAHIIAICGLKRSGKDTVADYICSKYGYQKMKFADPLKMALRTLFNFSEEQMEGDKKDHVDETWGITPRSALQFFGTEVMQYKLQEILPAIGRTFWAERLCANHSCINSSKIVISDMRFPHELDVLKRHQNNVTVICIDRVSCASPHDVALLHQSEKEYRNITIDYFIDNNRSIPEMLEQVDKIVLSANQS